MVEIKKPETQKPQGPTPAPKPVEKKLEEKKMKVSDMVITDEFLTAKETETGRAVTEKLMKIPGGGVILVLNESNKATGVISIREILKSIIEGKNPGELKAVNLMSTNILHVSETDEVEKIATEISAKKPHAIVVTDQKGQFRGYFSPKDHREVMVKLQQQKGAKPQAPKTA
jgi:signal-transduction protein with cAMP-binding, CBS, and nucleotidyltransferase domain